MLWTGALRSYYRLACFALVWSAMLFASSPSAVAIDWSDNFDGGTSHVPFVYYDNDGNSPPSATQIRLSNSALEMIGSTASYDTFVGATVGLGNPQYSFTDVRVKADVSVFNNTN